ncbi:hypothetical protein GYO_1074 [Bacillus spizizenii TU-B-10]|uniref:Uncharacterized protein n=1 Tax=Bacillus spizizenii (strain DSM 15029 / JCM 12233 / NBRC 101239 / NRRL B-23049 / TU-B-10) TaxID=1052585 RepID=G4NUG4_BACS4|nr:hypothetical protein GYO_1074 [Bacillus spizizenii TU-B-10]
MSQSDPFVSFYDMQKRPGITRSLTMIDVFISSEIFNCLIPLHRLAE